MPRKKRRNRSPQEQALVQADLQARQAANLAAKRERQQKARERQATEQRQEDLKPTPDKALIKPGRAGLLAAMMGMSAGHAPLPPPRSRGGGGRHL